MLNVSTRHTNMTYVYLSLCVVTISVMAIIWWKWYVDVLSPPWRIYYLYHGFTARHQTVCPAILREKNDIRRVMYVMPYIAASFTPVILIVQTKQLLDGGDVLYILENIGYL